MICQIPGFFEDVVDHVDRGGARHHCNRLAGDGNPVAGRPGESKKSRNKAASAEEEK